MKSENLISISTYAQLCGVSPQAIHSRRKNKSLFFITKKFRGHNIFLVDIKRYPPSRLKCGRKSYFLELEKTA